MFLNLVDMQLRVVGTWHCDCPFINGLPCVLVYTLGTVVLQGLIEGLGESGWHEVRTIFNEKLLFVMRHVQEHG